MLILAFDTSGFAGSVALMDGPQLVAQQRLDAQRRSAQTLAASIDDLLRSRHVSPGQIDLVATTIGPGSFTGLRVGITTAKTLAYAIGASVAGVSTLEALAFGTPTDVINHQAREIQAVLDAQRGELFAGRFFCEPENPLSERERELRRLSPDRIIAVDEWLAALAPGAVVTGAGLERVAAKLPPGVIAVPPALCEVQAASVGRLAFRDYRAGRRDDLWKLAPIYLRPSYAEEKAATGPAKQ